jgi:3-hydroxyacyl-CoA dehydrogenase
VVDANLLEAALELAATTPSKPLKKVRDIRIDYPKAEAFFQFARNTVGAMSKNYPAPKKCIDAVAAAVAKPFDEGIAVEQGLFQELLQTTESKALRHAFFGERAASKIGDVPEGTPTRKIAKVGVIGAGLMGGGIAMNFLNAGIAVVLLELKQEALEKGIAQIKKNYDGTMKKGKLTQEQLDTRMGLITPSLTYEAFRDVDLVIEAVFEDIGVKEKVFKTLDDVCKPGAILASNTSTLNMDKIASFTKRPGDVVGLHFFSPANVMKLLEVVRGKETSKEVLATVMQLAKKIKKTAVVSGVCDGFIGNRMLELYMRQTQYLVQEGATPWQVDRALEKWGMAMGPFRMIDMAGGDIGWAIRKRRYQEQPELKYARLPDVLCEMGRFGQKTGAGWYKYEPGRRDAIPDPVVEKLIEDYRKQEGITPRKISDEEIIQRCILALSNEGAKILEEGIAQRASDVDMVYLTGYGFPVFRGGPMFYADTLGLYQTVRLMKRFGQQTGDAYWKPAALLEKLAADGKSFTGA